MPAYSLKNAAGSSLFFCDGFLGRIFVTISFTLLCRHRFNLVGHTCTIHTALKQRSWQLKFLGDSYIYFNPLHRVRQKKKSITTHADLTIIEDSSIFILSHGADGCGLQQNTDTMPESEPRSIIRFNGARANEVRTPLNVSDLNLVEEKLALGVNDV